MPVPFIGREKELKLLKNLISKPISTLVVIKGRRRIGKSRLIEEFSKNYHFLKFSGLAPLDQISSQSQKDSFCQQLGEQLNFQGINFKDWAEIFSFLNKQLPKKTSIILFDEISWIGSKDPTFLPKLKNAWDLYFNKHQNFILVLCGSVSTWIEKNILNSTAFFGRIGLKLTLEDLSLKEGSILLKSIGFKTSTEEILRILSVLGGIPWYLECLDPLLSADENIKNLFFIKSGLLLDEFDRIFNDLFSRRGEIYQKIIEALSQRDLTLKNIQDEINYTHSGTLTNLLKQLLISGYLNEYPCWKIKQGKIGKQSLYHLSDPYLRFYIKYIQPNLTKIKSGSFEYKKLSDLPAWNSIMGLQLETLLLKNRPLLWEELNIHPQDIIWDNPYIQKSTKIHKGVQIDYLIHTRQNVLYLCEIKFSRQPLGLELKKEIERKINNFVVPKRFSVCPVLIHTSWVTDNLLDTNFFFKTINLIDNLNL